MGWGEFWARYATLLRRRAEAASDDPGLDAALAARAGHGMRQRGVMH